MKRARLIGGVILALLATVLLLFWGSDASLPAAITLLVVGIALAATSRRMQS